jgi:hypothetical protein
VYTVLPDVELQVRDAYSLASRIEFTQRCEHYLMKHGTSSKKKLSFEYPRESPSATETRELIDGGWITSDGLLKDSVSIILVPNFDEYDALNPTSGPIPRQSALIREPWVLKSGNGVKTVWCRVTYQSGETDTLEDQIKIAPYGHSNYIRLRPENQTDGLRRTMLQDSAGDYIINQPWIRFSASIFADTTIAQDFHYWPAFPHRTSHFLLDDVSPGNREWLETKAIQGRLTGKGAAHNDYHQFTYMLSPDSLRENDEQDTLSVLRRTFNPPSHPLIGASEMSSESIINRRAVPGSFWGANPVRWTGTQYESAQDTIAADVDSISTLLQALSSTSKHIAGKKEVYLFALFRGRFFDDKRLAVLSGEGIETPEALSYRVFFDLYPPRVQYSSSEPNFFNNGATLGSSFKLRLESVEDGGEARVEKIEYVIARKPENLVWNTSETPFQVTPADLLSFNGNGVFPFQIMEPGYRIDNVSWEIDASNWPTGEYIMGIVTADEFGNEGFAPMKAEGNNSTNPWVVTVETQVND